MSEERCFRIADAFVQVSPDAEGFDEELRAQLGDYVVQVPVVPDTGGFRRCGSTLP
jgi:hypothetical protein